MRQFKAPQQSLRDLDAEAAATLIATAADIAFIIDREGVVRDLAIGSEELSSEVNGKWLGQPWVETVTLESRPKLEALLLQAASRTPPKWRQVYHSTSRGRDIPVRYCAAQVGREGSVVAIGCNLQAMAALQQRLIEAQQSLERDYLRLRQAETRYRLLFQMMSEAVLIVDASTRKVLEANPAVSQLLGGTLKEIVGRTFPAGFDGEGTQAVQTLLAGVRAAGRGEDVRAYLVKGNRELLVSVSLLRQQNAALFVVRLSPLRAGAQPAVLPEAKAKLLKVIESAPDCVVVTGSDGRILTANAAFLDLAQLGAEAQTRGESLDRWFARPGVDLNVLISNLREHGSVRRFATLLRGEYGATAEVEISAVSVQDAKPPCFGFVIRNVSRRAVVDAPADRALTRSVEQLTELVGRVPIKEIVRQSTDVIERLCVEAALELTGDNRASAAELLGLSRQSLYVKLRRYGIGDLGPENDK